MVAADAHEPVIWGNADLSVTTDRAGFNGPERLAWLFQGPDLHWDTGQSRPWVSARKEVYI